MKKSFQLDLPQRPRRLRANSWIRSCVSETHLEASNFVYPVFVQQGVKKETPIASMPGQSRLSKDLLFKKIELSLKLGVQAIALFPYYNEGQKDPLALESHNQKGFLPQLITSIKKEFPEVNIISDVAMDPYSSDGHDGIVEKGEILNDESIEVLIKMALTQAKAGVDWVAPSDMMDGRIGAIRQALDLSGFQRVGIISYSAKYASAFYGPFRDALDSSPRSGDKKTYQMNPANSHEALREILLDIDEGADVIMVKPGLPYLDIIKLASEVSDRPIAAYQVSGEYAMIKAAAEKGWVDEKKVMMESLLSLKRAGATMIFTYFALDAAKLLKG